MRAFREETIRELLVNNKNVEDLTDAIALFNRLEPENVRPLVNGTWLHIRSDMYECSVCHSTYTEMNDLEKCTARFCPHCGASMLPNSCANCVHLGKSCVDDGVEPWCNLDYVKDYKDNLVKSYPTIENETDCPYYEPKEEV